jgi:hypothetical protein
MFHYHLLPAGVTGVIAESIKAILPRLPELESVILVCGNPENTAHVRSDILSVEGISEERIRIEIVGEIGYISETRGGHAGIRGRIVSTLLNRYSGTNTVWWVHNYHLGKNPYFTDALLEIADRDRSQRMIFQIHDFPECARYENLRYVRNIVTREVYPQSENIRYAVINARDKQLLEHAGIARGLVTLIENPLDVGGEEQDSASKVSRIRVRETLANVYGTEFPLYRPAQRMLLYPIRTIRRKNVMEAAFLTRMLADAASLVVTLPGVSEQERKYSAMVEQSFREGLVPGLWGIGRTIEEHGISFRELTDSADLIVSSSVQEGFGYQFINALTWGHPLCARYLDILSGTLPVFRGFPHDFYTTITVPFESPSLSSMRAYLRMRYGERLSRIAGFLSSDETDVLRSDINAMLEGDYIDFSYLAPQMQYTILKDLADPTYFRLVSELNSSIIASLRGLLDQNPSRHLERVERTFGYDAFSEKVRLLLASFDSRPAVSPPNLHGETVQSRMVRGFAKREYARLLYE